MKLTEDIGTLRTRAPEVIDLRGSGGPPPAAVLADPTGRRAALLRTIGRFVGLVFVLWFCGLVLAGLGLLPLSDLPLARSLGPTSEPTKLKALPRPTPPSRRDLTPARPLEATRPTPASSLPNPATRPVRRAVIRRQQRITKAQPAPVPPGRRLGTSQNQAGSPATTVPGAPGNSGTAPGRASPTTDTTTTTPTAPGRSGTAPGHDPTAGTGHGAATG